MLEALGVGEEEAEADVKLQNHSGKYCIQFKIIISHSDPVNSGISYMYY
jgi:hypothetical protein